MIALTFARRYRWLLLSLPVGILPVGWGVYITASSLVTVRAMRDKYDQIEAGMTLPQVMAIMDAPPFVPLRAVDEDWYFDIWVWRFGGSEIQVEFTQPACRASKALPRDDIATNGVGVVKFKRLNAQQTDWWQWVRGRYSDLIDP